MFPPLMTRTTFFDLVFNLPDKSAASGVAPAPSATIRFLSINMRMAEAISFSRTVTISVAQYRANILHIIHERVAKDIPIGFSKVTLVLETRDSDHIREIQQGFRAKGYSLQMLS